MENISYQVKIGETYRSYPVGTTYLSIAEEFQSQYEHQIVLAVQNGNRLEELHRELDRDCTLEFVTTKDRIGHDTYKRSMSFLMVKAVHDVGGHDQVERVRIHFSVSKGYYCTVEGNVKVDAEFLRKVDARMREIVQEKMPIEKRTVRTSEAIELFRRHGMYDKEQLFEYRLS